MNKDRKHIIFLTRWYPNKYDPMLGLFVQRHAEAAAIFNDISVIYVHPDKNAKKKFEIEHTEKQGIETIRVYYKRPNSKLISLIRFYKANKKALQLTIPADLFHVHILTRLGLIALYHKKYYNTPYIITEHWSRYLYGNDFHGFLRKKLTKKIVKNAKMVTTVTEDLASAMKSYGLFNDNYVILPNVVNIDMFHPIKKDNNPIKIIHVSCFEDKSKNISGLLAALNIIKQKNIDFKCILIGEGMDLDRMKDYAFSSQLNDNVIFTGLLEGQDLADTVASGDFFVLSSHYENMPVVILEALACGLPIVSTDVGGIHEIIDETSGILVKPDDITQLAESIIKMINTCKNYNPWILRNKVVEKYAYKNVGKLLSDWYNS